jgi:hypothetical protein
MLLTGSERARLENWGTGKTNIWLLLIVAVEYTHSFTAEVLQKCLFYRTDDIDKNDSL